MATEEPLYSGLVVFKNAGDTLAQAIASVKAQPYEDWELILVDDGSTDAGTAIARAASEADPRIRYLEHPGRQNLGKSVSRNLGIFAARGKYLALLDADDVWLPNRMTKHLAILDNDPSIGMVAGCIHYWRHWASEKTVGQGPYRPTRTIYEDGAVVPGIKFLTAMLREEAWRRENICPYPSGVTVRRDLAQSLGGFEKEFLLLYDDVVFFSKIFLASRVAIEHEVCALYRMPTGAKFSFSFINGRKSGDWHPVKGNPAELRYLNWLDRYTRDIDDAELKSALALARVPYRWGAAFEAAIHVRNAISNVRKHLGRAVRRYSRSTG
jgi:glycosyltransferase involved in cell wall biosynthesis